tara:strand:- start:136 stop:498 length:363 start_codon:yes stop_codon:yes gene_type:complete
MLNNMPIVKRCLVALFIFLVSLYFFPDWETYFELKNSLDMLLYTKLIKYGVLIYAANSFISNARKLSILGKKEKESSSKKDTHISPDIVEENTDPDLDILRNKPELKTKSDRIKDKYSSD